MAELGLGAYRFSVAWPRVAAGRRPGRSTPPGSTSTRGWSTSCWRAASRRWSRSTTGTCRRSSRTPAAGRRATPRDAVRRVRRAGRRRARRPGAHLDDAQRAVVLGVPRLRRPACTRPGAPTPAAALAAVHHLLLAHGLGRAGAAGRCRRAPSCRVTLNLARGPAAAATDRRRRTRSGGSTALANRVFLDPMLRGRVPGRRARRHRRRHRLVVRARRRPRRSSRRRSTCSASTTTRRTLVRACDGSGAAGDADGHGAAASPWPGAEDVEFLPQPGPHTAMGWSIDPTGLRRAAAAAAPRLPAACR